MKLSSTKKLSGKIFTLSSLAIATHVSS